MRGGCCIIITTFVFVCLPPACGGIEGGPNQNSVLESRVHQPGSVRGYPEKLPKPNRLDFTGFGADSQIEPSYVKYLDIGLF